MKPKVKSCISCKYSKTSFKGSKFEVLSCINPKVSNFQYYPNFVNATCSINPKQFTSCYEARNFPHSKCGEEGKFWERGFILKPIWLKLRDL